MFASSTYDNIVALGLAAAAAIYLVLVLVFPEGTKGTSKHYSERYQLRRFGRGGFVEIAMRAGVPVIPIAVVGAVVAVVLSPTMPPGIPVVAAAAAALLAWRTPRREQT